MKKTALFLLFIPVLFSANAQNFHVGIFGGVSAYNGDLTTSVFPRKVTNGALGITGNYELTDQVMIRAGLTYTIIGGADRFSSKPDLVLRNLSFETSLTEFSVVGEY